MPNKITFLGAARTVTGSRHLLELNGKRVLVDCGLFQGSRELRDRNWQPFPIDPSSIDAVVLTHAHTDHIGYLPKLVKDGFQGPIYATPGTIGLCKVSLPDGGRLQEEDARFHSKHGTTSHPVPLPLYTEADAYNALKPMRPVHYYQWQDLPGGAQFRYMPAGHILGAAFAEIYFENGERILMGGDLGRWDRPIIQDPTMVDFADYLVVESTYGDKVHPNTDTKEQLLRICEDAVRDRSVIVVPSFAIGRTQELLWFLHQLKDEGRFPGFPIYVDSPMASAATLLYANSGEDHDKDYKVDLALGHSPLQDDMVKFVRDRNMSKSLNSARGPFMVISGSGMMNGGRVLHHLQAHGADPSTILLFTGYQAEGTLGRRLSEGDIFVR
ncbi:MAG: MBL fold metallo-hydrolase, partial [bacterium]